MNYSRVTSGGSPYYCFGVRMRYEPDELDEWAKVFSKTSIS